MFLIQLMIVLLALYVGSRYGSLALGAISGIGLAIMVFCFGMKPGTPPTDVIYIIVAAVTCAGMLQASGGMDWLIQIAERLLRKHPDRITFYAPLCTFFLTVLVGTGHVVYTLMPIICDIALKKGIRPERPCGVASIASQVGITCSPIAAAVVVFATISSANGFNVTIPQILMVTLPASVIGILAASACSYKRGLDLGKDPAFQARLKDPEMYEYMYGSTATSLGKEIYASAKRAVYIFLASIAVIVLFASCQRLLPSYEDGSRLKMNIVIQIVMLTAAALMVIVSKASPEKAVAVSVLINSQGAVVVAMLPLAYSLGIPGPVLLGVLPSVYGYFFIPNYPSDIATVNFDRSGTTVIGKYLLNHSFMMPGLVSVAVSTIVASIISSLIF